MKSILRILREPAFIICVIFVILPFCFATFVPSTDLPQHLAQIRLLEEILQNPEQTTYKVNWFGANVLIYYLLGFNWLIFSPIATGKITLIELTLLWILSIFILCKKKDGNFASAAIASTFVFNLSLYWGFLNFLIGFPIFTIWYIYVIAPNKNANQLKTFALTVIISLLLFLAHTLWFIVSIACLAAITVYRYNQWRNYIPQWLGLMPTVVVSAFWFPSFAKTRATLGFDTEAHWFENPLQRLLPKWIFESLLGGIKSPIEIVVILIIFLWIVLCIKNNFNRIKAKIDRDYVIISIILAMIVLFAPDKYVNTIYFSSRWAPVAIIFFLLSLPTPLKQKNRMVLLSFIPIIVLSIVTSYYWYKFDKEENSGLSESLDRIPKRARVIGLDFVRESKYIKGRPFLQTFAYSQVLHGGELNFSFAEHHSGIVSYRYRRIFRWTTGLEWEAGWVQKSDFKQFDISLINAKEFLHNLFPERLELQPITNTGRWRIYDTRKIER